MKLSLVVPCYNEEGNIRAFIQKQSGYSMQKITSMKLFLSMMEAETKHRRN